MNMIWISYRNEKTIHVFLKELGGLLCARANSVQVSESIALNGSNQGMFVNVFKC